MAELTSKQWLLYGYLKEHYCENEYISKEQISKDLGCYVFDKNKQRNAVDMEFDIRAINECDKIQKVIVSSKYGYKIGNKEQIEAYVKKRFERDFRSLKLNWKLAKRLNVDGQMKIVFGKERDTIETFIKEKLEK